MTACVSCRMVDVRPENNGVYRCQVVAGGQTGTDNYILTIQGSYLLIVYN